MTDINERLTDTLDRLDSVIELMEEYLKEKQEKEKKLTEDNTVVKFINHMLETESISLKEGDYSRKVNLVKVSDLHQQYFKFCRENDLVPFGVRNFQKIVVDQYSPNPNTITTIYSGYNRFEFLEYPEEEKEPITYSNDVIEEFINSLINSGDIKISTETKDNPVTETLHREYVKYLRDNYPDDSLYPEAAFKLVLKDQFMPEGFSDEPMPIKYHVEFIHDNRVEAKRKEYEERKRNRPAGRMLPHSPSKENTN